MNTRTRFVFLPLLLATVALLGCADKKPRPATRPAPPATQAKQPVVSPVPTELRTAPFTDAIVLIDVAEVPAERTIILETPEETWAYVPAWQDLWTLHKKNRQQIPEDQRADWRDPLFTPLGGEGGADKIQGAPTRPAKGMLPDDRRGAYRQLSPIVVRDKKDGKWRMLGISRRAPAVYPVQADPVDRNLIWVGCNDGPPGLHSDYAAIMPGSEFDAPLTYENRGGLGLIDVAARAVKYFGPRAHLASSRVYSFKFEDDAVWVYGFYPLGGGLNGITRYDRKTRQFTPVFFPRLLWLADTDIAKMPATSRHIEMRLLNRNSYVCWYSLDKQTLQWQLPEYRWVGPAGATLREAASRDSRQLLAISRDSHYKPRLVGVDRTTYGHPLVWLSSDKGWDKVRTSDGVEGWAQADQLVPTLPFVRQTLDAYVAAPDLGNEGHRYFLWNFSCYCSDDDLEKAMQMIGDAIPGAPAHGQQVLNAIVEIHKDRQQQDDAWRKQFQSRWQAIKDATPGIHERSG